jgi:hypothetical protein
MVWDEVVSKILPSIYEQWKVTKGIYTPRSFISLDGFLRLHNLTKVSASTIWCWVRYIGYSYCEKRKSFYVNGHERPDVVQDRVDYCKQYLLDEEPRCLRWKCLPLAKIIGGWRDCATIRQINPRRSNKPGNCETKWSIPIFGREW